MKRNASIKNDNGLQTKPSDWIRVDRSWLKGPSNKAQIYTARLTVDITEDLHQKIKRSAINGRMTVACMLRNFLAQEFDPRNHEP